MSIVKTGHLKTLDTCNLLRLFPYKNSSVHEFIESVQNVNFIDLDDLSTILVMKHPSEVYFKGILEVYCVSGKAEVNGYHLIPNENNESVRISSLNGGGAFSIVCLENSLSNHSGSFQYLESRIPKSLHTDFLELLHDASAVLILKACPDFSLKFISNERNVQLLPSPKEIRRGSFFSKTSELLDCVFDLPHGDQIDSKLTFGSHLKVLGDTFENSDHLRVMVCGGKNMGKSTLLRYLVNRKLNSETPVLYIDFDIGQPEFTVPGCVSVVFVRKPLLGPSYTHLQKPLKSIFLGFVNPRDCITSFLQAVKSIKDYCFEQSYLNSFPWFINTMGYTKGFGLVLILEIIKIFNLTNIIQLSSIEQPKINFNNELTHDYVRGKFDVIDDINLNYQLHVLTLPCSNTYMKTSSRFSPKVNRELLILSYMAHAFTFTDDYYRFSSSCFNLIPLSRNDVVLKSRLPLEDILSVVSGREIVALGTEAEDSLDLCIGFGVILDETNKKTVRFNLEESKEETDILHIVTPLSSSQISFIKVIIRGELGLSDDLFEVFFSKSVKSNVVTVNPKPLSKFHTYLFKYNP